MAIQKGVTGIKGKIKILIGLLVLLISFFSFLFYKFKEQKEQREILEFLSKEGINHRFNYSEWTDFLPEKYREYLGYSIEIQVIHESILKMGLDEPELDLEVLQNLSKLKNVSKVIYSGRDNFMRDRLIETVGGQFLKSICEYSKLKNLELNLDFIRESHAEKLGQIKSLESLTISSDEVPENLLQNISNLTNLKNLRIDTYSSFNQENINSLKSLQKLEILFLGKYLFGYSDYESGYYSFHKIDKYLPPLKKLKYLGTSIDHRNFDLSKFPSLIWYRNSNIVADAQIIQKLGEAHKNQTKEFDDLRLLPEYYYAGLEVGYDVKSNDLAFLNKLTFLESLIFQNPNLDYGKVQWEKFTNLKSLEFPMGVSLVDLLPHLKKLKSLEYLKGAGKDFTFEHFSKISQNNKHLKHFYLTDSRIDETKYEENGVKFQTDFLGNKFYSSIDLQTFEDKKLGQIKLKVDIISPEVIRGLDDFSNLHDLTIECNSGLENLNQLKYKNQLKSLTIKFKMLPKVPLKDFKNLHTLSCDFNFKVSKLEKVLLGKTFTNLSFLILTVNVPKVLTIDEIGNIPYLNFLRLFAGNFVAQSNIKLPRLELFSAAVKCNIENLTFSKNLNGMELNGLQLYTAEQLLTLNNHPDLVENLNLSYLLDPEKVDIKDLNRFKNLKLLSLPPKSITKDEIKELVNSLPKLSQLHIRNTGLRREDIPEKEGLHISYE